MTSPHRPRPSVTLPRVPMPNAQGRDEMSRRGEGTMASVAHSRAHSPSSGSPECASRALCAWTLLSARAARVCTRVASCGSPRCWPTPRRSLCPAARTGQRLPTRSETSDALHCKQRGQRGHGGMSASGHDRAEGGTNVVKRGACGVVTCSKRMQEMPLRNHDCGTNGCTASASSRCPTQAWNSPRSKHRLARVRFARA